MLLVLLLDVDGPAVDVVEVVEVEVVDVVEVEVVEVVGREPPSFTSE